MAPVPNTRLRCVTVSSAFCSCGSEMRIGFDGAYGWLLLVELEDLPNQFIGPESDPESDGRCAFDLSDAIGGKPLCDEVFALRVLELRECVCMAICMGWTAQETGASGGCQVVARWAMEKES